MEESPAENWFAFGVMGLFVASGIAASVHFIGEDLLALGLAYALATAVLATVSALAYVRRADDSVLSQAESALESEQLRRQHSSE